MRQEDDQTYYAKRARQERERAERSTDNTVAIVHYLMATAYERRVAEHEQDNTPFHREREG